MALARSNGMLIGSMDVGGVLTPVEVATGATAHSSATVDLLGDNLSEGQVHLWLMVGREVGNDAAVAPVKLRLNGIETPALVQPSAAEEFRTRAGTWDYEADIPVPGDLAGFRSVYVGLFFAPRYVDCEILNGHSTDSIFCGVRYQLVKIS